MNPIIFTLGFIEIRWYSVLILTAFIIGYLLIYFRCKKLNIDITKISDLCFNLIIVSIIGARLYYCIFNFNYYSHNLLDIFKIWEGGLAIHGGIIASIIYIIIKRKKLDIALLKLFDLFAPSLVLGQAIGRWGNFFNGEAYGPVTTLIDLKNSHIPNFVINGMNINGHYHIPTFFYESIGCLLIFMVLIIVRNSKRIKEGQVSAIYFIGYGLIRFYIESLRQDSLMLLNIKTAQLVSIIMIIVGIYLFIKPYIRRNNDK